MCFSNLRKFICDPVISKTAFLLVFLAVIVTSRQLYAAPVVLKEVNTLIVGKTRREALLKELQISEGQEFQSFDKLDNLLRSRLKTLMKRRLFTDAQWDLRLDDPGTAVFDLRVVDSFTLYPRPVLRYSSSNGITLGLKLEYLNAFGTLTDNVIETYWSPSEILFEVQANRIILGPMHLDTLIRQYDGTSRLGDRDGDIILEYRSKQSYARAALEIPLGRNTNWKYRIAPSVSWLYDYRFVQNATGHSDGAYDNTGFSPALEHGILFNNIEWKANFRRGLNLSLLNTNQWYIGSSREKSLVEFNVSGYFPLARWWEISGRIGGFYAFTGIQTDVGDRLRGIIDYNSYGERAAYLNLQTNFKVLRIDKVLELQLGPFADFGFVDTGQETGIGFSTLLYFDSLPSLVLNVDFGWDLNRDTPEIIIETRQFF